MAGVEEAPKSAAAAADPEGVSRETVAAPQTGDADLVASSDRSGAATHDEQEQAAAGVPGDETAEDSPASDADELAAEEQEASESPDQPTEEEDPEAAAAARELAEHNALADLFDAVRVASRDGHLSVPSAWEENGFVPAHMTADEFEMYVYEYLENYLAEHKQELAAEKAEAAAKASTFHSATHAVGIPPKIPNRRLAQIKADEEAEKAKRKAAGLPEEPPEPDDADTQEEAPQEPAPYVRPTFHSALAPEPEEHAEADEAADDGDDRSPFAGLKIPEGYRLEQLEGEYCLVPDEEDEQPKEREINCHHIAVLVGQHSYYLYDTDLMTDSYAHWSFLAAEDNPLATFVDCVREDGRVYPRPFDPKGLCNAPFRMTEDQIEDTWEKVRDSGDYPDIKRTQASNGDVYYYSTLYMGEDLATSLAEWESVGHPANS